MIPGPAIVADQSDAVKIVLHNDLGVPTALLFQGQAMASTATASGRRGDQDLHLHGAERRHLPVRGGPCVTSAAGTQYQAAMGLYGALVVRPTGQAGQAYDGSSAFDDEPLVVVGEIDPALNTRPDPRPSTCATTPPTTS